MLECFQTTIVSHYKLNLSSFYFDNNLNISKYEKVLKNKTINFWAFHFVKGKTNPANFLF